MPINLASPLGWLELAGVGLVLGFFWTLGAYICARLTAPRGP
jgi:hypothetical protein